MRILVSCQHYWPEPFNTSDVCEELVRRGHSVTVITGMPNTGMADNDIPSEYRGRGQFEESRATGFISFAFRSTLEKPVLLIGFAIIFRSGITGSVLLVLCR